MLDPRPPVFSRCKLWTVLLILGVVAAAWGLSAVLARHASRLPWRAVALYVIGTVAAFWSITRVVAIAA